MPPARFNPGLVSNWGRDPFFAAPRSPFIQTNIFVLSNYLSASDSAQAHTLNTLFAYPLFIDSRVTFNQVAVEVTTAVASSTVRLGLYTMSSTGTPNELIADWGTVDTSSLGAKTITIDQTLFPGTYFLTHVAQGGAPGLRSRPVNYPFYGNGTTTGNFNGTSYNQTATVTGALPSTFGAGVVNQFQAMKIMLRIA